MNEQALIRAVRFTLWLLALGALVIIADRVLGGVREEVQRVL